MRKEPQKTVKFLNPVFRMGMICSNNGPRLSSDQASLVGKLFSKGRVGVLLEGEGFSLYNSSYKSFCKEHEIVSKLNGDEDKKFPRVSHQLTPIVNFPAYYIKFKGEDFVVRESATICVGSSDSKLWISVSKKVEDSASTLNLQELHKKYSEYIELRAQGFLEFYNSIFKFLINAKFEEFDSLSVNDIDINVKRKVFVVSAEVRNQINPFLKELSGLSSDKIRFFLQKSGHKGIFNQFTQFSNDAIGLGVEVPFNMFIQNSVPVLDSSIEVRKETIKSYENYLNLDRIALCLAGTVKGGEVPIEYYFTIGQSDSKSISKSIGTAKVPYIGRKFRNADLTSRSIMKQVGRVF